MRLPDVHVSDELHEQVMALLAVNNVSYAALVRYALRVAVQLEQEKAVRAARAGTHRQCVVCEQPRRADGMSDAMAHAQCDQTVANLERMAA
jgi:hypothetical protein